MPEILILGGGFAGLWAALVARRQAADNHHDLAITMVSKDDQLTLRPRLYEPEPERFRVPLRPILDAVDVNFIENTATNIDTTSRQVTLATGADMLAYDRLILATGSVLASPPIPGIETAFNLDSWASAMAFDAHLKASLPGLKQPVIAIMGAGFTGIEAAMEMRGRIETVSDQATAKAARILLLDRADEIGAELGDGPRPVVDAALASADVEIRLGAHITAIDANGLTLADGEQIQTDMIVVCTGMKANPLTEQIAAPRDEHGRLTVTADLRIPGFEDIFATGDVAHAKVDDAGHVAMMSCQHAMTMGRFAGHNAANDLMGLACVPYQQERYVTCLDLGSAGAVYTAGWDRVVQKTGMEAKQIKQTINSALIYPPSGNREQILAAAALIPGKNR